MAHTDAHTNTDTIHPELMLRINEKRALLLTLPRLSKDALEKLDGEMKVLHTFHSNAMGRNSLTFIDTQSIVTEDEIIRGRPRSDQADAVNTAKAYELMDRLAKEGAKISNTIIQGIHEVVIAANPGYSGKYRRTNVKVTGPGKDHPPWTEVLKLMNQLLVTVQKSRLHTIETAAYLYHGLVDIHPFTEGNGKVARLVTCMYLMSRDYPPIVMRKETHKRYTHFLKSADAGDILPLSDYIAKAVDESLTLALAPYGGDDELMKVEHMAEGGPYSVEYLNHRAEKGLLDAVQIDFVWYTSIRAVERYLAVHESGDGE
jgi:Fic family protein